MIIDYNTIAAEAMENLSYSDAIKIIYMAKMNGYDMQKLIDEGFNAGLKNLDAAYERNEIPLEDVLKASEMLKSIYELI